MLKTIFNYCARSLDYPVGANPKDSYLKGNHYFLDLSQVFERFPFNHLIFDEYGIARYDYGRVRQPNMSLGLQYNSTYICWWALSRLEIYLKTADEQAKEGFLKHVNWLQSNQQKLKGCSVWPFRFNYLPELHWLRSPWISGMDQGLIISVLVRAFKLTKDNRFLDTAKSAGLFFAVPLEQGGFRTEFAKNDHYYEMYPVKPLSKVLDGFVFSLMGLFDLLSVWKDSRIEGLYQEGLSTLRKHVDFWDFRGYWSRFGTYYLSPPWYHKINYAWMRVLSDITQDAYFGKVADHWNPARLSDSLRAKVKIYSYLFSRKHYLKRSLLIKIKGI